MLTYQLGSDIGYFRAFSFSASASLCPQTATCITWPKFSVYVSDELTGIFQEKAVQNMVTIFLSLLIMVIELFTCLIFHSKYQNLNNSHSSFLRQHIFCKDPFGRRTQKLQIKRFLSFSVSFIHHAIILSMYSPIKIIIIIMR